LADHWIMRQLSAAADTIDTQLAEYRIAEASETVYHTIWDDVADWYIEASKTENNPPMLAWVLETSLKLAHPFAPFVTETIWQTLWWKDTLVMKESWPTAISYDSSAADTFGQLQALVSEIRFVSAELPVRGGHALLYQKDTLIDVYSALIAHLASLSTVTSTQEPRGLKLAASGHQAWLDIDEKTLTKHREALETRLIAAKKRVASLQERLTNETYTAKAPASLVEESRKQLAEQEALVGRLETELSAIK
jgi:valyl-tRNA synthetase